MAGFQLFTVLSIIVTGAALEAFGDENVRVIVVVTGVLSLIPLVLWAAAVRWLEHHRKAVVPPEPATSPVP